MVSEVEMKRPLLGSPLVKFDGVKVDYHVKDGKIAALGPVTFNVNRGEFLSIIGPSGCGKSTLLKVLAGLFKPTEGTVEVEGSAANATFPGLGMVFQDPLLVDWRTVLGNVLLQADVRRLDRKHMTERARQLLRRVGLEQFADRRPYELSGGMQQRVALCRALLHEPTLVLMDEPFGALDAMTREEMAEVLRALWADVDVTTCFVTHSIPEAIHLSTRVLVLSARPGVILADLQIDLPPAPFAALQTTPDFTRYVTEVRGALESGTRRVSKGDA